MHRGFAYPFHPDFYATEAWFWPGYMPYTLAWSVFNNGNPPWNIVTSGYGEISQPGVPSADRKKMVYDFTYHSPSWGLQVTLDRVPIAAGGQARWHMKLAAILFPIVWGEAYAFQTFPQRRVLVNHWDLVVPAPPYSGHQSPPWQFSPAPWGDGPDPYPSRP